MLGDFKDEYAEMLNENPNWYVHEFMEFGPKMYQLVLRDMDTNEIVRWDKTMKRISMKGGNNKDVLLIESLPKYREPVIDYCTIFCNMVQVIDMIT